MRYVYITLLHRSPAVFVELYLLPSPLLFPIHFEITLRIHRNVVPERMWNQKELRVAAITSPFDTGYWIIHR